MALTDLPVLSALKQRMHWHDARQRVLAENVANANMPNFTPHDVVAMNQKQVQSGVQAVRVAVTQANHIEGKSVQSKSSTGEREVGGWETTPDGNSVVLEEQMMKLTENQMEHQMVTTLYSRSLALLRSSVRSG
ncbi:MAG: flagellar basal body rod protein FlgB [Rhizobiales bacterium]|nr:flagellar basal body rod protein FlgB [Hyphomicrobiales bacterium]